VYTGDFERWTKKGYRNGASLYKVLHEGDLEGGFIYWGTQRYVKQGSEMGVCFHRGPSFVEHGLELLSWGLLIRGIFMRSLRDMQNTL
jgi:hypothetical protein